MSVLIKKISDILSGSLDKIGKNIIINDDFILNQNNYLILNESNKIKDMELLKIDTPPTGLLYNIGSCDKTDTRNYFYSCLNLVMTENEINELTSIEEYLFANSYEFSTSKLANVNDYILNVFINNHNSITFESVSDIKQYQLEAVYSYLNMMKMICEEDRALYKYIPCILNLQKNIY